MTTRQNEVRRILQKLNGKAPTDLEVSTMANIAEAAEIRPDDALFPLMVALEYYRVLYEKVPESIKEASSFLLRENAEAFRAEAAKISEEHKGKIEEASTYLLTESSKWLKKAIPEILHTELEKATTLAVRAPVNAAAERFEKATRVAESAIETLQDAERSNAKTWIVAVAMAAVIGGAVGGGVMAWALNRASSSELTKEQQTSIQWGAAVQAAWAKLPAQSQKAIKDAANGKGE